jgi:hypothetical protein
MVRNLALAIGLGAFLIAGTAHAAVDPALTCKNNKAKATGKKASDVMKAFGKNIKKSNATKLGADISKAESKFTKAFTKAEAKAGGLCLTSGDSGSIEDKVNALVAEIIGSMPVECGNNYKNQGEECDGTDDDACPGLCSPINCLCPEPVCGNSSIETGEQCDPPCSQGACPGGQTCNGLCQCEPVAACDCGVPDPPEDVEFTTAIGVGDCGITQNQTGDPVLDLACGGLYIGSGGGDLTVPAIVPDFGTNIYKIECCNNTNLTLGPRDVGYTGSYKTCTSGTSTCSSDSDNAFATCRRDRDCPKGTGFGKCERCFFGAPLPNVRHAPNIFLSTCLVNAMAADASGSLDCATGDARTNLQLHTDVVLRGIDYSPQNGWQSCPVCVGGTLGVPGSGTCEGGPNNGLACAPGDSPIDQQWKDCCAGGALNGQPCTDDSECPAGTCVDDCSSYPTSHDCPPDALNSIGVIPVPFPLTSETSAKVADVNGNFCGFCRDVLIEGSNCFEGDPDPGLFKSCPGSNSIACDPGSGVLTECGDAVPCRTDADTVRSMSLTGVRGGNVRDRALHPATHVSAFCIQSTFAPSVDNSAALGGPGAVSLQGVTRLLPSPSRAFLEMTSDVLD